MNAVWVRLRADAVSVPVVLLALVIPGAIGLANLVSIGPAVTAMRTRPASVLPQE